MSRVRTAVSCVAALVTMNLFALSPAAGQASSAKTGATESDSTFPWVALTLNKDSTAAAQLSAAVRVARQEGRTPIIEVGAPWCGPCHQLEKLLKTSDMHATMQHMYVISLNNDVWKEALLSLGYDVNTGIPRMMVIDSTGHPVGEPWRPRDVPDSLTEKVGLDGAWRTTLTHLFATAQQQYAVHH